MDNINVNENETVALEVVNAVELFTEILEKRVDFYDISSWIDEDLFTVYKNCFSSKKDNLINKKMLEKILNYLIEKSPNFFNDMSNKIFLKLFYLYEMNMKKNGEDQELYYIVDRFGSSEKSINEIIELLKEKSFLMELFTEFIKEQKIYDESMSDYIFANMFGQYLVEQLDSGEKIYDGEDSLYADSDLVREASDDLNKAVKLHTEDYALEVLRDEFEYFENYFCGIFNVSFIALLYTSVYGKKFTHSEKLFMANELDETQQELLSNVVGGRNK